MPPDQASLFDPPRAARAILPDRYLAVRAWWPVRSRAVRRHVTAEAFEVGDRVTSAMCDENAHAVPVRLIHLRSLCVEGVV